MLWLFNFQLQKDPFLPIFWGKPWRLGRQASTQTHPNLLKHLEVGSKVQLRNSWFFVANFIIWIGMTNISRIIIKNLYTVYDIWLPYDLINQLIDIDTWIWFNVNLLQLKVCSFCWFLPNEMMFPCRPHNQMRSARYHSSQGACEIEGC